MLLQRVVGWDWEWVGSPPPVVHAQPRGRVPAAAQGPSLDPPGPCLLGPEVGNRSTYRTVQKQGFATDARQRGRRAAKGDQRFQTRPMHVNRGRCDVKGVDACRKGPTCAEGADVRQKGSTCATRRRHLQGQCAPKGADARPKGVDAPTKGLTHRPKALTRRQRSQGADAPLKTVAPTCAQGTNTLQRARRLPKGSTHATRGRCIF